MNINKEKIENLIQQAYIEVSAIHKEIRTLIWHTDETTKALNKLIRKQEKFKNYLKEKTNE